MRFYREHPDYDPDDGLPIAVFPPVVRSWCGRPASNNPQSCGCCCAEHDDATTSKDAS